MPRSGDEFVHSLPLGLDGIRDVVAADVVTDQGIADLVGRQNFPGDNPVVARADLPRVRPILVALAARASGATQVDGEPQYAAEMLHLGLAVHDLALGREGGRRRRVARRLVKRSVGWLGGNHLTLRALELGRHANPHVFDELLDTVRELSDGQALCRVLQSRPATVADWQEHADAHTGALFTFCCRAGGHIARADAHRLRALGRYGRHVGRLWHVAEDVGTLRHGDAGLHLLRRSLAGRPVLPVVRAAERSRQVAELSGRLVDEPTEQLAADLAGEVQRLGGVALASRDMARESWSARRLLAALPDSRYRRAMDRLAGSLAKSGVKRAAPGPRST